MKWLSLAWRNLLRNPRRTFLTLCFISFSLMALIFVDGLIRGMTKVMVGMLTETLSGHAQIHHPEFLEEMDNQFFIPSNELDQVNDRLKRDNKVLAHASRARIQAMLSTSGGIEGAQIYGVEIDKEREISRISQSIIKGNEIAGPRDILLGYELADRLEMEIGDRIVVTAPSIQTGEPNQELFRLVGTIRFNQRDIDEGVAIVSLQSAQSLIGMNGVHEIVIKLSINNSSQESLDWQLSQEEAYNSSQIKLEAWQSLFPQMYSLLGMQSYSTAIIAVILFTLAGLGIINTLFMSIYERYYEFGVLKSIGTTPIQIAWIIFLEAILLGALAMVFGTLLGLLLEWAVAINGIQYEEMEIVGLNLIEPIRPLFHLDQVSYLPSWVMLLTLLSALYPAIHAARIIPARALRKSL